jgi:hypothetical protein
MSDSKDATECLRSITILAKHIDKLEKENEVLREALEFYAHTKHIVCMISNNDKYVDQPTDNHALYDVNWIEEGQFARQALEQADKIRDGL